jgi:hypothetical protein
MKSLILLPALASLASAHYDLIFPEWRGDSFADDASQWIYPCANVTQESSNRTLWPLDGGAVTIGMHHPWTYYAVRPSNPPLLSLYLSFEAQLTDWLCRSTSASEHWSQRSPLP